MNSGTAKSLRKLLTLSWNAHLTSRAIKKLWKSTPKNKRFELYYKLAKGK